MSEKKPCPKPSSKPVVIGEVIKHSAMPQPRRIPPAPPPKKK